MTDTDAILKNPLAGALEAIRLGVASTAPAKPGSRQADKEKRIAEGRESIEAFLKTYLGHLFTQPFGEHHQDIFDFVQAEDTAKEVRKRRATGKLRQGKHVARAEPREHGKSAVMVIGVPLWWAAYRLKKFIVLIGSSSDAIEPHFSDLQSAIDPALASDSLLLEDFPHLQPALDFKNQFVSWTDSRIRLQSGLTIAVKGMNAKFRGLKEGGARPDAIVIDDPQDEDDVLTYYRREKIVRRFHKTVLNLGSENCDYIVEGNLMHKESLLAQLCLSEQWDGKVYRAENLPPKPDELFPIGNTKTDGSPLWPEMWPMKRLRAKKALIGRHYQIEFMNEDRGEDDAIYQTSKFMRFDRRIIKPQGFTWLAWHDPATGSKTAKDPDFAAVPVVATRELTLAQAEKFAQVTDCDIDLEMWDDPTEKLRFYWIVDCYLRREVISKQVQAILKFMQQYPISKVYYESNAAWQVLIPTIKAQARRAGVRLPLSAFSQSQNKVQRIMNAEPVVTQRCFFAEQLSPLVFGQFGDFPLGHDDAPDAIVAILERFEKIGGGRISGFA